MANGVFGEAETCSVDTYRSELVVATATRTFARQHVSDCTVLGDVRKKADQGIKLARPAGQRGTCSADWVSLISSYLARNSRPVGERAAMASRAVLTDS